MAVASIDFTSKELKMNTLVTVSFPDSVRIHGEPLSKKKVLWLLHGLSDDGTAWLRYSNIDRPPLGDVANAFILTASSNPDMDFVLTYRYDGQEYCLDTADVREIFGDVAFRNLTIVKNVGEMLKENIAEIRNS